MSSTPSQSVITHNHAFCGDMHECAQFPELSTPCYFELGAAKVGVLFVCSVIECLFSFSG